MPGTLTPASQVTIEGQGSGHAFAPARVQLKVGSSLTWTNKGASAHGAEARDGSWATRAISANESGSVRFEKPGTDVYVCPQHPLGHRRSRRVAIAGFGGAQNPGARRAETPGL